MKRGHSRPSSNDSTVPDTAPTANRIAVPLAQRLRQLEVDRVAACAVPAPSAITISTGSAMPTAANTMWNASDIAIWPRAKVEIGR